MRRSLCHALWRTGWDQAGLRGLSVDWSHSGKRWRWPRLGRAGVSREKTRWVRPWWVSTEGCGAACPVLD